MATSPFMKKADSKPAWECMERATGFEPATSTLARLRATNCAKPACTNQYRGKRPAVQVKIRHFLRAFLHAPPCASLAASFGSRLMPIVWHQTRRRLHTPTRHGVPLRLAERPSKAQRGFSPLLLTHGTKKAPTGRSERSGRMPDGRRHCAGARRRSCPCLWQSAGMLR